MARLSQLALTEVTGFTELPINAELVHYRDEDGDQFDLVYIRMFSVQEQIDACRHDFVDWAFFEHFEGYLTDDFEG